MRLDGIDPGDIVRCSVRGRLFHAIVKGAHDAGLRIEPIERGVTHHHVRARDVIEHWARRGRPRADATSALHPEQRSLEDLWDR